MIVTETKDVRLSVTIPAGNPAEIVKVVFLEGEELLALPTREEYKLLDCFTGEVVDGPRVRPFADVCCVMHLLADELRMDVQRSIANEGVAEYCRLLAELITATARLRGTVIPEEHISVPLA